MIDAFFDGLKQAFLGFSFLKNQPKIRVYFWIPLIINILVVGFAGYFIYYQIIEIENSLKSWLGLGGGGFLSWLFSLFFWLVFFLLFFYLHLVFFFFTMMISQIINAPLYDLLSEKTEQIAAQGQPDAFSFKKLMRDFWMTIGIELKKAGFFLLIWLVLTLLYFLPIIGSFFSLILSVLFGAWAFGFSYGVYPLTRKVASFRDQLDFGKKNKARLIGFGLPLMIPGIHFFAPFWVISGTLMYLKVDSKYSKPKLVSEA